MSSSPRSLTFIVNPISGHPWSRHRRLMHELLSELSAHPAEVLITQRPKQATEWAAERAEDPNAVVIAVGGDGTVHEVATGLIGGQAALGVLPVGSGNDFATMLSEGMALHNMTCSSLIHFYQMTHIALVDVGWVVWMDADGGQQEAPFINSLGLGLEGAVARTVRELRAIKGLMRYVLATLWQVARYQPIAMRLILDNGHVLEDAPSKKLIVAIGNGRRAGGGFVLQPQASIDDGYLDVCWANALPIWQQLKILPSVLKGEHGRFDGVYQQQIKAIEIHCEHGTPMHLDGEWVADRATHLHVAVKPRVLRVVGR